MRAGDNGDYQLLRENPGEPCTLRIVDESTSSKMKLSLLISPNIDLDTLRGRRALADDVETELVVLPPTCCTDAWTCWRSRCVAAAARKRAASSRPFPEILGAGESSSASSRRAPTNLAPDLPDERRRHIDRVLGDDFLARMPSIEDAEMNGIQALLAETERDVSEQRKVAQQGFDAMQAEIMRRYKDGLADDTDLLAD